MRITAPEPRSSARRGAGFGSLVAWGWGVALRVANVAVGALFVAIAFALAASLAGCAAPRGTVGAVIAQEPDTGRLFLRDVPPGLAAARAGLKSGDEILLIDGVDVRVMSAKEIHAVLSGDVDTEVKFTVIRGEGVLRVTLKRTEARKLLQSSPSAKAGSP